MELFVKYGGMPFWSEFINRFYDKVTRDGSLREFFAGKDIRRIKEMQLSLLEMTLTGGKFPEDVMNEVHRHLGISDSHFRRFIGIYERTLLDLGVESADVAFMIEMLQGYHDQVVIDA